MNLRPSNIELKVMTPSRYKRRHSHQDSKILLKTAGSDCEAITVLPGVLMTYNEKFMRIGINSSEPPKDPIYIFRARTDSMESVDI